jgi:hypothetical protein
VKLAQLIRKRSPEVATATVATVATVPAPKQDQPPASVASVATVAVADLNEQKTRVGSLRARFPLAAEKRDELLGLFGTGIKVAYARNEAGDEYGQRLLAHEIGVPLRVDESPTMPTPDCRCSSCERMRKPPSKTEMRRKQREAGSTFGLDRYGKFKAATTYRRDLDQPWSSFVAMLRKKKPVIAPEDE